MNMTNCINCGSAKEVTASVCPFCGTSYFDLTDIDLSEQRKPCVVRFKFQKSIFQMKAYVNMASFEIRPNMMEITSLHDSTRRYLNTRNDVSANIEFVCCE